jgi:rhamnogalacturonyl hydrolase YesR
MKKFLTSIALAAVLVGCSTTAQRQAVNTIGGVETSATALVDGYYTEVLKGNLPTNDVPTVSRAYDSLQASIKLSLTVVQNNTNALAPASLLTESMDLVNLVNQIKGKK